MIDFEKLAEKIETKAQWSHIGSAQGIYIPCSKEESEAILVALRQAAAVRAEAIKFRVWYESSRSTIPNAKDMILTKEMETIRAILKIIGELK